MDPLLAIGDQSLQQALEPFLGRFGTTEERIEAVQAALESGAGRFWRKELGKWTVRVVPVELLVPDRHRDWRPLVRESVRFIVSNLSASRLAPKIVEQTELAANTSAEVRLLRFIAKVPGLQKIGQVLARTRDLDPRLRRALVKLEDGIADVTPKEIRTIIERELAPQRKAYRIEISRSILSEASVSAVVPFSWRNPATRRRERGVFKVLKPHISACYAEDMKILGRLARHLAKKRHVTGTRLEQLAETLVEIRLLLEREVDFPREQATLANGLGEYRSLPGVRIPRLIAALSTDAITALTYEKGRKVTEVRELPAMTRWEIAERLAQSLLAVPALSREKEPLFHADPHAGNLLYDRKADKLVILDWALTERLTRKQRRNVLLLVLMLMLRDADGARKAITELCQVSRTGNPAQVERIRQHVERLLGRFPLVKLPGPMDAMRLLDRIALDGIHFPAALLMFRKAAFTLEGVVEDVAGSRVGLDALLAKRTLAQGREVLGSLLRLLSAGDWVALDWSALTFTSRWCACALFRPWFWRGEASSKAGAA